MGLLNGKDLLNLYKYCNHLQPLRVSCSFRVCFTFGKRIKFQIQDVTPTFLSPGVISTLKQADHVAYSVIHKHGKKMPIWSRRSATISDILYLFGRKILCLSGKSQGILKTDVFGNHVKIVSYCFYFSCGGQTQPDADCFNTNPLRPRSYRPYSIVSAVCCDQNFYHE